MAPKKSEVTSIPKLVHWFYEEYLGRTPDRTVYAKYQRILRPLVKAPKNLPAVRTYKPRQLAQVIEQLDELGVPLEKTGLEVLLYPDLIGEVLDGDPSDYVRWIQEKFGDKKNTRREDIPSGW